MRISSDDYIPIELYHESKDFIQVMSDNVEIYCSIRKIDSLKPCEEADKFVAYWNFARYNDFPHALITLYENMEAIDDSIGTMDQVNAIEYLQLRMKKYYLLLKENGMIDE